MDVEVEGAAEALDEGHGTGFRDTLRTMRKVPTIGGVRLHGGRPAAPDEAAEELTAVEREPAP